MISPDLPVRVLAQIEAEQRAFTAGAIDLPPEPLTLSEIRQVFDELTEAGVSRRAIWRPAETPLLWGLRSRVGVSLADAALVWLAIRESLPLVVADDGLFEQLQQVNDVYPEFQVDLVGS